MPAAASLQSKTPKRSGCTDSTISAKPPEDPANANSVPAALSVILTAVGIVLMIVSRLLKLPPDRRPTLGLTQSR
jgi:hypothetical protein